MLYFSKQNLVFLANPKTGTTAIEKALTPQAAMIVRNPPGMRHMNVGTFRKSIQPFIRRHKNTDPEIFVVVREPLSHLLSWYRYRRRQKKIGTEKSTLNLSAEAFIEETMKDAPDTFARIGSQARFVGLAKQHQLPEHMFPYEHPQLLLSFLRDRFGVDDVPAANVSPREEVEVDPAVVDRLRAHRARDFELYDEVLRRHGLATGAA
jgi:hypothetical protein